MNVNKNIGIVCEMSVQVRQINALTGKVESESKPQKNLIMDGGLNALAKSTNSTNPAAFTTACRVGSGSTSDKTSSGAITFTQVGTTLTASGGFFTAGMVGFLFKWGSGTGGVEQYITAFTNSTNVTVDTSATVAVPAVGVVWNVIRTTMETLLYSSNTYETTAGACGSSLASNIVTHKRTYNFAQQVASYNVNEVGYFNAVAGTTIYGRLVLVATEVVAPTNFLQVVLSFAVTYNPGSPVAVSDVGTNINTAGNAMVETSNGVSIVLSTGATQNSGSNSSFDGASICSIRGVIATYSQNSAMGAPPNPATLLFENATWAYASPVVRGKMTIASNTTISGSGQTMYGVALTLAASGLSFDIKFTSTYAVPSGSFLPKVTFSCIYDRQLNN